ncbi:MAG: 5-formyltetrahydrofolate cyclo-ligase, partial [Rhizobiales bacterium]|nr:5-formyltetrahydrofolate cyclo-ligase [Hyphomicrobiales bacterium]
MGRQSLATDKAELRKRCHAERLAIDRAEAEAAAAAVAKRIGEIVDITADAVVSAYWPLAGELDPGPALLTLTRRGAAGALPRVIGHGHPLAFHAWQPDDRLIEGRFNVMEPAADAPTVSPSVLLVPLLAFDRACRRLGHGRGYYDRTLQILRASDPDVRAIGVAFAAQEVERVPHRRSRPDPGHGGHGKTRSTGRHDRARAIGKDGL